jgi:hypothetical protein
VTHPPDGLFLSSDNVKLWTVKITALKVPLKDRQGNVRDYAYVSPSDSWVLDHKWTLMRIGYVQRYVRGTGRNGEKRYMHREILGLQKGDGTEVDHIDRNRLNNRRENLRVTDRAGNAQNVPGSVRSTDHPCPHRGVSWHRECKKWMAYGHKNRKRFYLGLYADMEEAARVAREWRERNLPLATD